MLGAFSVLLMCQLAGEVAVRLTGWPLPGAVAGMLGLALVLIWRGRIPDSLRETSGLLLANLSLLFVPAGTGIIEHLGRLGDNAIPIIVIVIGSTVITLLATAWTFVVVTRCCGERPDGERTQAPESRL